MAKRGIVTIAGHPGKDMAAGTEASIYHQAGIRKPGGARGSAMATEHVEVDEGESTRVRIGHYVGVVTKTGTGYSAHVPSLAGLGVAGDTFDETVQLLRDGIRIHLEALAQDRIERPWLYEKRRVG